MMFAEFLLSLSLLTKVIIINTFQIPVSNMEDEPDIEQEIKSWKTAPFIIMQYIINS